MTGAGISAESGVATFRDADGLWHGFRVEEVATPEAFAEDPQRVWSFYAARRRALLAANPNRGHHALTRMQQLCPDFTLITQNVDGLHERAGAPGVLRMHGSIWDVGCWNRCPASPDRWRDDTASFATLPPRCPHCDGPLRPGVVWFGEVLDAAVMRRCLAATRCDVFLTVGTSAVVYPAAGLLDDARRRGAMTVEINPVATQASPDVDVVLAEPAETALIRLDETLGPHPLRLSTARLRLEPIVPRDAQVVHALWTDPDVRRYLWDDRVIPLSTAREATLASARDFAAHRFGLWLLRPSDAPGSMAGFCGLRTEGVGDAPELLFGLLPEFWGQGLAREASRAVLHYVLHVLAVPRVIAATDVPNERSARTLAALGMQFDRRGDHQGLDTVFFSVTRAAWLQSAAAADGTRG
jgi:NAD-dependent deacetylase